MSVIHAAKRDSQGIPAGEGETPCPGYYFLLPLTVPIDIGTLPLQGIVYFMFGGIDC